MSTVGINASKRLTVLLFVSVICLGAGTLDAATYYVSTTGNDTTGDGSIGNPWKTITKGQSMLAAGDTLLVRGGRYYETVTLTVQGSEGSPITIQNYPEEEVVMDGTQPVADWAQCTSDEPFLTVQGVTNPNYANIYKAKIPAALLPSIRADTTQNKIEDFKKFMLFEDGVHSRIARWPDQEFGYGYDTSLFNSVAPEAYGETNFLLDTARLDQADDYWVGAFIDVWSHAANNIIVRRFITSNSQSEHTITFHAPLAQPISYGTQPDAYSIINHPHVLNNPGEYAHTTEVENIEGVDYYWFYFWPKDTVNLENKITIPSKGRGIYGLDKQYITFDGFSVMGYTERAIYLKKQSLSNIEDIIIKNCIVQDAGYSGIQLDGAKNAIVENCVVNRTSGFGIYLAGGEAPSFKVAA